MSVSDNPKAIAAFITTLVSKHPEYEREHFIYEFKAAVGRKHQLSELTLFMSTKREFESKSKKKILTISQIEDNPDTIAGFIADLVIKHPGFVKEDFAREFETTVGRKHRLNELTLFMQKKDENKKVPDNSKDIAEFMTTLITKNPSYGKEDFIREFKAAVGRKHQLGELTLFLQKKREAESRGQRSIPPVNLPAKWLVSPTEQKEQEKRWARFAQYMSRPYVYSSKYSTNLQELDTLGCINVQRIRRQQWPRKVAMRRVAAVFFCTYEGLDNELCIEENHINIVDDASLVAETYVGRGYRVLYYKDPTTNGLIEWLDFLVERAEEDVIFYFIGYGKKVLCEWSNGIPTRVESCLLLYNENRKKNSRPPMGQLGATTDTVTDGFLFELIDRKQYPDKAVTLILDLYEYTYAFSPSPLEHCAVLHTLGTLIPPPQGLPGPVALAVSANATYTYPAAVRMTPPPNTVLVENVLNVDAMLVTVNEGMREAPKGSSYGAYSSSGGSALPSAATAPSRVTGQKGAVATDRSSVLAKTIASLPKQKGFFSSLNNFTAHMINAAQNTLSTAVVLYSPTADPGRPLAPELPQAEAETPLSQALATADSASSSGQTGLPAQAEYSPVEIKSAEERWKQFTQEMKKPAAYTSKYRAKLIQLDEMGAINLSRIKRAQIPNIQIDRAIALFFCPYEDLPRTLDDGPVNDGVSFAKLYTSRGYRVVYFCDATAEEYYMWMDWLLDNVRGEIVSFFSGHGTQLTDTTGKEKDGKTELMVFYNENPKVTIKDFVSDEAMHSLIVSKNYPDTRIVLFSDCCHSGTLFNFDGPLDPSEVNRQTPLNVVHVGAARDDQVATQLGDNGVFTSHFTNFLEKKKNVSFKDLEAFLSKEHSFIKFQDVVITCTDTALLRQPVIIDP